MLRVLIGISGSGKTYRIQERILRGYKDYAITNTKGIYVVERKEYDEYSHVFHPDFVAVYKPTDSMVDSLRDVKNAYIVIDCEDYSEEFMEKVSGIARQAIINNNDITITFTPSVDIINRENQILIHANSILVGHCGGAVESLIEKVLHVKLEPMTKKFDFRKVV